MITRWAFKGLIDELETNIALEIIGAFSVALSGDIHEISNTLFNKFEFGFEIRFRLIFPTLIHFLVIILIKISNDDNFLI